MVISHCALRSFWLVYVVLYCLFGCSFLSTCYSFYFCEAQRTTRSVAHLPKIKYCSSFYRSESAWKRGFLHTTKIFANNQFFAYNLFLSAVVSRFCCFDTWILYRHAQLIKIGTWESSNWLGHSHKKKTAKSDVVWFGCGSIYGVID